jgi:multidrug efflux pump subunit AcrA (membrane-fusion protein)
MTGTRWVGAGTLAALLLTAAGCGGDEDEGVERARPVTVLELQELDPARTATLTGVVEPFREERVGFEVGGRVDRVREVGQELRGEVRNEAGEVVKAGDVIAQLDPTRYEQRLRSLELEKVSAERDRAAATIDLEELAKADLEGAEAQLAVATRELEAAEEQVKGQQAKLDLETSTLARQKELFREGNLSRQKLDEAQARFDAAEAALQQAVATTRARQEALSGYRAAVAKAQAAIHLKQAQIEKVNAQIAVIEQSLVQARTDLADCVLRAPFTGRITERHVSRGAYAQPGSPVVTLTMLDPIKVVLTVSAGNERRLQPGTLALVRPEQAGGAGGDGLLYGVVVRKASVADPATRTFEIEVLVRNVRQRPTAGDGDAAPLAGDLSPVISSSYGDGQRETAGDGALFVNTRAIVRLGDEAHVLRVPGVRFGDRFTLPGTPVIVPERIPVTLGEGYRSFIGQIMREARAAEGAPAPALAEGHMLLADPTPAHAKGFRLERSGWVVRPGDLVPVGLAASPTPRGFYVPLEAISARGEERAVYVVTDDARVKRVAVRVGEALGERRRVEGAGLAAGTRVVVSGVHFVADGDTVTVVGTEEPGA